MEYLKRIAVIGAGPSGLASIKSCKENGIEPVCFERNGDPGGLWVFHEEDAEGVPSVMKNTIMNTGKEMCAFSDFPPPKEFPNYPHHSLMREYLQKYAKHFDLLRHIRFYQTVVKVEPTDDHDKTGRWTVTFQDTNTGETANGDFDGVMVCVGHHVYPKIPTFPGQEKFRGLITHSHSVKSCDKFSGKKVVVVGLGNSGGDVAVDSSMFAEKVYMSTRSGSWIFSRIGVNGRPYDMDFASRKKLVMRSIVPFDALCDDMENSLNQRFNHEAYKLKPKHRVFSAHPTLNDILPACIISGRVVVKGDIERFEENGVVFAGEDEVTEADAVVLCTGYLIKFPFLGDIVNTENNNVELYKYIIPPHLKRATLAMIGLIQPIGPIAPVAEMQGRWFLKIFMGNIKLPSVEHMLRDIKSNTENLAKRYVKSSRHTIEADWIPYIDFLANQIGAKPNLPKMALTDPKLFLACFSGPCLPYQFRLEGPDSWSGAREAILSYEDRVYTPLNSNQVTISKSTMSNSKIVSLSLLLLSSIDLVAMNVNFAYRVANSIITSPLTVSKWALRKVLN